MRTLILSLLVLAVSTALLAAAPRGTVALGVGASSASEVVVKIDGKDAHVKLAGVPSEGTYPAQEFLQCLVAERVVRVDRAAGRVTMLDGTSVADHLNEFLQTRTQTDPCALGKAAYAHVTPHAQAAAAPVATIPVKGAREGHVSFASGNANVPSLGGAPAQQQPSTGAARPGGDRRAPAATTDMTQPGARPGIYQPPTVGTTTVPQGQTQSTLGTTQTYAPQTTQTTALPAVTAAPPVTGAAQNPQQPPPPQP